VQKYSLGRFLPVISRREDFLVGGGNPIIDDRHDKQHNL